MLSEIATRLVQEVRGRGELEGATHVGTAGEPGEGPFVRIWLRVESGRIVEATYDTHGCPASVAAGSMAVTLARGRTRAAALTITDRDLLLVLGGLPEGKEGFATLAIKALQEALKEKK